MLSIHNVSVVQTATIVFNKLKKRSFNYGHIFRLYKIKKSYK